MKWVTDSTRRLKLRPHYNLIEIDEICESHVTDFLVNRYGVVSFPIESDDIEVLIEQVTSDYDPYADLDDGIEGMTKFMSGTKPAVFISSKLAAHKSSNNRRRTTLTHELGHVILHADLWADDGKVISCNRDNIEGKTKSDWMEWQAYYASGAYLMPKMHIQVLVDKIFDLGYSALPFLNKSSAGHNLIISTKRKFDVSKAAAIVRLKQLGIITLNEEKAAVIR